MRRLATVFALIALLSATLRIVTPVRIVAAAMGVARTQERIQRALERACLLLTKRLRPLLPQAD